MNIIGSLTNILIQVVVVLIALTGHEFAHGWVSSKFGDPTPKRDGRLTLNPLAHLDFFGTLLMVFTGFGWAKPVMINPMYYKNKKLDTAIVSLAGPLSNFIMALLGLVIYAVFLVINLKTGFGQAALPRISFIAQYFAMINLCFMIFNLIPIPPLDGSKILGMFLPDKAYYTMLHYERYSMIVIMILSIMGVFGKIIGTGVDVVLTAMITFLNNIIQLVL